MNKESIKISHFEIFYNKPSNVWNVNDYSVPQTLGHFVHLEDAQLFVAAKMFGVIEIKEREIVPAPNPPENIKLKLP